MLLMQCPVLHNLCHSSEVAVTLFVRLQILHALGIAGDITIDSLSSFT